MAGGGVIETAHRLAALMAESGIETPVSITVRFVDEGEKSKFMLTVMREFSTVCSWPTGMKALAATAPTDQFVCCGLTFLLRTLDQR